ncbi:hypothetical protein [Novosphingopyxis sp.]|uniref:hypothetical protein n=1 Tax=Novosphingopyxis sp. TaxID=2709690 RepID=UPI003B5A2BF2
MTDTDKLIRRAVKIKPTDEQKEAQRRSFAYGNAKTENDRITREMVDDAAAKHPRGHDD